ncbi:transposase family protein [Salinivibrio costicola]
MTEDKSPFMHFVSIRDIRQEGKVEHTLSDIILITICAVLSGHDTWKGMF